MRYLTYNGKRGVPKYGFFENKITVGIVTGVSKSSQCNNITDWRFFWTGGKEVKKRDCPDLMSHNV